MSHAQLRVINKIKITGMSTFKGQISQIKEHLKFSSQAVVRYGLCILDDDYIFTGDIHDLVITEALIGGGGDGGSIPKRLDMIQTKGYSTKRKLGGMGYTPNTLVRDEDESLSNIEFRALRLSTCALTQTPLTLPVVIDAKGQLISKAALIEALLNRKGEDGIELPEHIKHIKGLKYTKEITKNNWKDMDVSDNDEGMTGVSGASNIQVNRAVAAGGKKLWCPLKNTFIQGTVEGAFSWNCGCVFSLSGWSSLSNIPHDQLRDKVLKMMHGEVFHMDCPVCGSPLKASKNAPSAILLGHEVPDIEKRTLWSSKDGKKEMTNGNRVKKQKVTADSETAKIEGDTPVKNTIIEEQSSGPAFKFTRRHDWDVRNPLAQK